MTAVLDDHRRALLRNGRSDARAARSCHRIAGVGLRSPGAASGLEAGQTCVRASDPRYCAFAAGHLGGRRPASLEDGRSGAPAGRLRLSRHWTSLAGARTPSGPNAAAARALPRRALAWGRRNRLHRSDVRCASAAPRARRLCAPLRQRGICARRRRSGPCGHGSRRARRACAGLCRRRRRPRSRRARPRHACAGALASRASAARGAPAHRVRTGSRPLSRPAPAGQASQARARGPRAARGSLAAVRPGSARAAARRGRPGLRQNWRSPLSRALRPVDRAARACALP